MDDRVPGAVGCAIMQLLSFKQSVRWCGVCSGGVDDTVYNKRVVICPNYYGQVKWSGSGADCQHCGVVEGVTDGGVTRGHNNGAVALVQVSYHLPNWSTTHE